MSDSLTSRDSLIIRVGRVEERLKRTRVLNGPDVVIGKFSLALKVSPPMADTYVPISIASGKKPTGFVYQIEGTGASSIVTGDISCKGDGITQVRLGTVVYCKIPKGMTAEFRIRVEVRGQIGKSYMVRIYQVNYKNLPTDARYQKSIQNIGTRTLKFS